ncbi:MAG: PaaI family thioesterase, partial [Pseudomonadota bacterium]
ALTVSPDGVGVLTTELKVNFLRPASGSHLIAKGRVLKPGKTLSICTGDVFDIQDGAEKHVLTSLVTMMHVDGHTE